MTNPPLMKVVAACRCCFLDPELPETGERSVRLECDRGMAIRAAFLYENGSTQIGCLFAARLPFVALGRCWDLSSSSGQASSTGAFGPLRPLPLRVQPQYSRAHATHHPGHRRTLIVFSSAYFFWRYTTRATRFRFLPARRSSAAGFSPRPRPASSRRSSVSTSSLGSLHRSDFGIDDALSLGRPARRGSAAKRSSLTAGWIGVIFGGVILVVVNLGYGFQGSFLGIPAAALGVRAVDPLPARLSSFGGVFLAGRIYEKSVVHHPRRRSF